MKISAVLNFAVFATAVRQASGNGLRRAGEDLTRKLQVDPPTIDVEIPIICFSGRSTVEVEGKGSVALADLQIGDSVLAFGGYFETVYAFAHRHPTSPTEFLQIRTTGTQAPLEISAHHMLYVFGEVNPVRSDSIKVGDELQCADEEGCEVTKIKTVKREGLYAPLTPSGRFFVDGILASNYVSLQKGTDKLELKGGIAVMIQHQSLVHMALSPVRMMHLGVYSPTTASLDLDQEGMPYYVSWAIEMSKWVNGRNAIVQVLILLAFLSFFGPLMVVENAFGPSWAPSVLLATSAWIMLIFLRKNTMIKVKKV